jgi:lycopene cyclase domain-containing protein
MTYAQFLVLLLAPALVLVAVALLCRLRRAVPADRVATRRVALLLVPLAVFAVLYTTPWDSWLIAESVWWYDPGSVLGSVFLVPIEEYLFMAGQTLLTGLWTLAVTMSSRSRGTDYLFPAQLRRRYAARWALLTLSGVLLATLVPGGLYLGAIFAWFGPPLAVQAAAGADVLRALRRDRLLGLSLTLPLWLADTVAIHAGAWHISQVSTLGVRVLGLPLEEAVFFLCTNLLVVNSVLLMGHPLMRDRLRGMLAGAAQADTSSGTGQRVATESVPAALRYRRRRNVTKRR